MNVAAGRQIKVSNALRLVNNRLSPTDSAAEAALLDALSGAIGDEAQMPRGGHSLGSAGLRRRGSRRDDPTVVGLMAGNAAAAPTGGA